MCKKNGTLFLTACLLILCLGAAAVLYGTAAVPGDSLQSPTVDRMGQILLGEDGREENGYYRDDPEDQDLLRRYMEYNSDVVAYITIPDTALDHPVVQTVSDETYYLYRDLNKEYNSHGVPFLSGDSIINKEGTNSVIYGHNICLHTRDVFCDLAYYEDPAYYQAHPYITVITREGTCRYLIFAYFIVDNGDAASFPYSEYTEFDSRESFEDFMYEIRRRNWLEVDVGPEYGDTFLTLSSCSNELADGRGTNRMAVVGKLISWEEDWSEAILSAKQAAGPLLPRDLW